MVYLNSISSPNNFILYNPEYSGYRSQKYTIYIRLDRTKM